MTTKRTALFFTLWCFFLASTALIAQNPFIGGFQLKKVGAQLGQDQDMLGDMQANYFLSTARSGALTHDYSELNLLPADVFSMICENPHLRLTSTWQSVTHPQLELGLNLLLVTGRIDAMQFRSADNRSNLRINQYSSEVAFEPTLGYRLGRGSWNITGIIGGNLGYHFGELNVNGNVYVCEDSKVQFRNDDEPNANCVSTYVSDYAQTSGGISSRLFAETKFSFTIAQRMELGLHFRYGKGMRFTNGASTQQTTLHSGGVSAAWVLR